MNNTNQNTNTNTNKNQNELGALWKKKSKAGMSFLSGYINDHDGQRIDVVVFANGKKTNERAPDYRLYVSKPLDSQNKATSSNTVSNTAVDTAVDTVAKAVPVKKIQPVVEEDEDDIL
jgi:uncharacterized protein (DUF736 family)